MVPRQKAKGPWLLVGREKPAGLPNGTGPNLPPAFLEGKENRLFLGYWMRGRHNRKLHLQLEQLGWRGLLWEEIPFAKITAQFRRSSPVLGGNPDDFKATGPTPDFLAIRGPGEFPWVWDWLRKGVIRPR